MQCGECIDGFRSRGMVRTRQAANRILVSFAHVDQQRFGIGGSEILYRDMSDSGIVCGNLVYQPGQANCRRRGALWIIRPAVRGRTDQETPKISLQSSAALIELATNT